MAGMTLIEIKKLVDRYIGVVGGHLGQENEFSYRTLHSFYPEYCGLNIDTDAYQGTKRERFEAILRNARPGDQAKIIIGILERLPPDPAKLGTRTQALHNELKGIAERLEGDSHLGPIQLETTSEVVEHAIRDAESLIHTRNATSGVDRVHTALHGYLLTVCDEASIPHDEGAMMPALFKKIRADHPAFKETGPRAQDITQVLRAMGAIMDALHPIRNNASVAHPNEELLDEPEAMLAINSAQSVLHYLDAKLKKHKAEDAKRKPAAASLSDDDIPF